MTPRRRSRLARCCDTILSDMICQIVSAIANCCATILVVKAIITSQRNGFCRRSSAALIVVGIWTNGNVERKTRRKVSNCSSAILSGTWWTDTSSSMGDGDMGGVSGRSIWTMLAAVSSTRSGFSRPGIEDVQSPRLPGVPSFIDCGVCR